MDRFVPIVLTVAAIGLHLHYCEWDSCENPRNMPAEQSERMIYFRYDSYKQRGDYVPNNFMLLAKAPNRRDDAQTYGVFWPLAMVGGAVLIYHLNRNL